MSKCKNDLIHLFSYRELSRRNFLGRMVSLIATSATATLVLNAIPLQALAAATQDDWRFCKKCSVLFFDGYRNKGRCSVGDGHVAAGYNFRLTHDSPGPGQSNWRFCNKCNTMFFDGYDNKGRCPAGGGHVAQGYNFIFPHDRPTSGLEQRDWRFCNKCEALFFDGYRDNKGRCPAGGAHVAQGYNFVLRFRGNLEDDVILNPVDE